MKFIFDSKLPYQLDAIEAVTNLFDGIPESNGDLVSNTKIETGLMFSEFGTKNDLVIDNVKLLENLHAIQEKNNIPKSRILIRVDDEYKFPNFSVEMETGTGKTYVYLRSIFELNRKYGFKKFIIVVPSVAIREGVLSSIGLMDEHFSGLYNNTPFDHFIYNSKDLSKVRQFAVSNEIQIMIINIQAFQKDAGDIDDPSMLTEEQRKKLNIIHQEQDRMSGRRPIDFIRSTNPVVIIDEPQSVDNTVKSKRAIKTLNPLFCLRFSATHINPYNLLYKLDPIRAYDMRLVKQIEVDSIFSEGGISDVYLRLDKIGYAPGAKTPHAKATIYEDKNSVPKPKSITLKQGTDISTYTNRPGYEGYIVTNINAEEGLEHVEFANGKTLEPKQEQGGIGDEMLRAQIFQSVEEHFKKEKKYKDKGIKVLTLFFIDRVDNYRWYDDEGNQHKGKIAQWFEEAYNKITAKPLYKDVLSFKAEEVHNGYFSVDKKKGKIIGLKDSSGITKADEETYEIIMRDKERLLSMEEPLRFIFSHSALKEGWDNPNVFQICTLREMGTDRERRQTLGRGLRLPVNRDGARIYDDNINKLTVIASESFEEYARGLQADIERDLGGDFKFGRIEKIAFARLITVDSEEPIGQEESERIWNILMEKGYLNEKGDITDKFVPEQKGFRLELIDELAHLAPEVTDIMKRYIFKNRIVNVRDRRKLKYNKRIELNEDFRAIWEKINKKTRYSVEFKTEELVEKAIRALKKMDKIRPVSLYIEKTNMDISSAGVEAGHVLDTKMEYVKSFKVLPDILSFLQRETDLTRSTLTSILVKSGRLGEFSINPQSFMSQVVKIVKRALNDMVVDGIKYEQMKGQVYEMRLFEEEEIETYLSRLYEVRNSDKTVYDYVEIDGDSSVEKEVAERLDSSENIKFFCKLPKWFVVPTPVGNYNPDWAIVTEYDGKLYLVGETKGTLDSEKRREIENNKIECGRAHFNAIGVPFRVATNVHELIRE